MGFYRHDQWGVACLADEVQSRNLERRGLPPVVPVARLFDSNQSKQGDQYKDNAQTHDLKVET